MEQLGFHWTDFHGVWVLLENLSKKIKFSKHRTRLIGTLHEDQIALLTISRSFFLGMRNVSDKSCRKKNTFFV